MGKPSLIFGISLVASDADSFVQGYSQIKLRGYQEQVANAICDSVVYQKGLSFAVMFPRQSGKNEVQAQIEAYLLALMCQHDAEIIKVSPTWKPQSLNAMRRLERVLQRNTVTRLMGERTGLYLPGRLGQDLFSLGRS